MVQCSGHQTSTSCAPDVVVTVPNGHQMLTSRAHRIVSFPVHLCQAFRLNVPDHLSSPIKNGGRKWTGDETTHRTSSSPFRHQTSTSRAHQMSSFPFRMDQTSTSCVVQLAWDPRTTKRRSAGVGKEKPRVSFPPPELRRFVVRGSQAGWTSGSPS